MARTRFGLSLAIAICLAAGASQAAIVPPLSQPSWKELGADQQRILAPLSGEWDKMDGFRRKKWVGIAQRYQSLSPDEQARMQRRMTAWAKLTPDERKRARDQYLSLKRAPPEKKAAVKLKWEEYKELPESEKDRLKAEAVSKPTPRPTPSKTAIAKGSPSKASLVPTAQSTPTIAPASPSPPPQNQAITPATGG